MEKPYAAILEAIDGLDHPETLAKTPEYAATAMRFLTSGYQQSLSNIVEDGIFPCSNPGPVTVEDIEFYSLCEHHLLPFFGRCHVTYLPSQQVLGLSKIAKIVDLYSRRLQIQERLTEQIANAIHTAANANGVAVVMEAQHLCMMMRGIQKQCTKVITTATCGTITPPVATHVTKVQS